MGKEIITFGNTKIEKQRFCHLINNFIRGCRYC